MLILLRLNTESTEGTEEASQRKLCALCVEKNLNFFPAVSEIASLSLGIEGILSEFSVLSVLKTLTTARTHKLTNLQTYKLTNLRTYKL